MIFSPVSPEATAEGIRKQLAEQHRVSTDPKWCKPNDRGDDPRVGAGGETAARGGRPAPLVDGRTDRKIQSQRAILEACRSLMQAGNFRPSLRECCRLGCRSHRTGFEVVGTVETMLLEALKDETTRNAVLEQVLGVQSAVLTPETQDRILRAIIKGRV